MSVAPLRKLRRAAHRAGPDRRRCRRRRGRTNRSRTSPRAARAAGCACADRTSCREARCAAARVEGVPLAHATPWRCAALTAARPPRRRNAPLMHAEPRSGRQCASFDRCTRSLNGSRCVSRRRQIRCASVWMTATSSASRAVVDQARRTRRSRSSSRPVRSARLCNAAEQRRRGLRLTERLDTDAARGKERRAGYRRGRDCGSRLGNPADD